MTCVVGIAHDGKVYIGADSAGTGGWQQRIRSDLKVFTNGSMVFGFGSKGKPETRITAALEAAAHFSAAVAGPFTIVVGGEAP